MTPRLALPPLGLGTAGIGNLYRAVQDDEAQALLEGAWAAGIRYFDTAPFYGLGRAEQRLGRFLAGVREPLLVSTKVGRVLEPVNPADRPEVGFADPLPFAPRFDYGREGILRSFEGSVARLGRIPDVVLLHDIGERTHGPQGNAAHLSDLRASGFRALEELRKAGVRAFGIGVNETEIALTLLDELPLDLVLLAGRHTLLDRGAGPLLRAAEARGVAVVAAGAFNSGILATGARPGAHFDYAPASPGVLARVAALERLAARHGTTLPALALQFVRQDPAVVTLLLGASTAHELATSLAALAAPVPPPAWAELR